MLDRLTCTTGLTTVYSLHPFKSIGLFRPENRKHMSFAKIVIIVVEDEGKRKTESILFLFLPVYRCFPEYFRCFPECLRQTYKILSILHSSSYFSCGLFRFHHFWTDWDSNGNKWTYSMIPNECKTHVPLPCDEAKGKRTKKKKNNLKGNRAFHQKSVQENIHIDVVVFDADVNFIIIFFFFALSFSFPNHSGINRYHLRYIFHLYA